MKLTEIDTMIKLLSKLPGLGPRSARRVALHLIKKKETLMIPLSKAISQTANNIKTCECGNLDMEIPCMICMDIKRNKSTICVIEEVSDLWALERSGFFNGIYQVLGGTLDALSGIGPDDLNIATLFERIKKDNIKEVILATSATLAGQTTAHYIYNKLKNENVNVTRLARGLPVGGELDYLDDGTIQQAIKERIVVNDV